jgi:LysM repeat protein
LALIVAVGLVAAGFQLGAATVGERLVPTQSVVVTSGDTLWSIARDQLGQAGGDDKVRDLVLEIDQINGLASSELVVGQVLEVPRR